jgi:Uncharacterized conserved protein
MGTASYILVGTKEGEEAFYSTCHGAVELCQGMQQLEVCQEEKL